ncbi:MAG: purine-nucleoside phosphorylase [Flavobacteriales bacterium]|nr:purine-nucleoside phosphorylase [Flavobacteriales bacterium]MCW8912148.1 purine-nucleoside phosphorylase [Flavobacteriales bacterium]MCW8939141.1 purine-nucleoside phosphorylase [Flavobacteriales bacterium]MCW8969061.1 purine-nucleoside phosphorylase [Flavobacteriales bacterium]MCW8990687.1 purine-nucleoside phosphorylase [Flavobacteriales bacterium]
MENQLKETLNFIKGQGVENATVGIILGTGLGGLVEKIEIIKEISYDKIPHFPVSTVESHVGKLIYGKIDGKTVIAMQGRFHYYEGYDMKQIAYPVKVLKNLGVKFLLISNAAGTVNLAFKKSELMLITDHINMFPSNPLIGKNNNEEGPRFPDMSCAYNKKLNKLIEEIAQEKNITLRKGVYVSVSGPNLETRAEYKMLKLLGADAVGMSTVPEVIAANHLGLPCCAISVLTDECDPENLAPVALKEILAAAAIAEPQLTALYAALINRL